MPDRNKSPKDKVIFALAVKHSVISNRAESSKIEAAFADPIPREFRSSWWRRMMSSQAISAARTSRISLRARPRK